MWIMQNNSFISIVEDVENDDLVVVRARKKGDLENAFGEDIGSYELDTSDYRWRTHMTKVEVAKAIFKSIMNIDYFNFKNSVSEEEKDRKEFYMSVWANAYNFQTENHGHQDWSNWVNYRAYEENEYGEYEIYG